MSCSVCPGFVIDDFKWASVDELLVEFPEQAEIIRRLQPDFVPEEIDDCNGRISNGAGSNFVLCYSTISRLDRFNFK